MLYNHICDWRYQEMKRNIIFPWLLPRFVSIRCCLHVFSHTSSHTNKVFPRLVPWSFLKKFFTWLTPRSLTYTLFFPWFFPKFLTSAIKFPRFPPENLHSSVPNFQPKQKRPVIEASGWNKLYIYISLCACVINMKKMIHRWFHVKELQAWPRNCILWQMG